jgi:AcrR family transcriptional regulator
MKTKAKLGLSLKKFMTTDPLDTISVISITKDCHVNRQTFYYHFRNIYDLLTWVFLNEEIEKPNNGDLEEGILIILRYVKHNESLITNTLASAAKDLVREFLFNYLYNLSLDYIQMKDSENKLTNHEKKLLARVYGSGITSSVIAWLEGEVLYSEPEFVIKLVTFFKAFPLDAIKHKGEGYA